MSFRTEKKLSLAGVNYTDTPFDQLRKLFRTALKGGMHSICFSAYEKDQQPGHVLSEEMVRRRIDILKPFSKWVRSFSCIEGNELIPKIARESGMKTLVGAWLGNDLQKNEQEIENLIKLAKAGFVDIAAVGNEVMYRGDLNELQLLQYLQEVKQAIPDTPNRVCLCLL